MYICVLEGMGHICVLEGIGFAFVSMVFRLDVGTILTVCYFVLSILFESKIYN